MKSPSVYMRYGCLLFVVNAFLALLWPTATLGQPVTILALGDSLTAGHGLPTEDSFPAQLQQALTARGHNVKVINAGVSGDTTAGGRARLPWLLKRNKPDLALVALGANDGLRGLDSAQTKANLDDMISQLKETGARVLLAGMLAPPNLGREYGAAFNPIFEQVARSQGVAFYPFFLEGVAAVPSLNQEDGIHPNADGVKLVVSGLLPHIERILKGQEQ